ncbi:argininosuccinate lyase [Sporosarcina sp. HYO08]|uniref:argininosuccinate lyase n=1 Tax=Sporosarcina sp. HYO08 TaxID=1759557 RepID=UPI000795302C|nr:argininosuccinate lyase [Sporosarcina sp. HYO08]KXH84094.1 argininosuccinate lyase [Sporosarcina sp. HYO08]
MLRKLTERINEMEGKEFPSKTYRRMVLQPAYDEAKKYFLTAMVQIHVAHLKMLEERGIVKKSDARTIGKALAVLDVDYYSTDPYNPLFEDLFFRIEHDLIGQVGEVAGNLHIARSRNDMGIAIYRMTLRKKLLELMSEMIALKDALIIFCEEHIDTVMIGYTHTQQAQPTTLAHYLKAVIDQLGRDFKRVQAAFATVNRSSMGAAALTTSGFAISRERMRDLLAFDEVIENSWDAVAGADYITEAASAVQLAALNMGRTVQDLLIWATQEFNVFTLASPYVQISSIMPQKRNPVSIEHMRSLLSAVVGDANTVLTMVHNTPFGDIVDTEDDMQPFLWKAIDRLIGIYQLFGSVVLTMKVNKDQLRKRAEKSFATVTELADTLVRTEKASFRQAHQMVSQCVQQLMETDQASIQGLTWEAVNQESLKILHRKLTISKEDFQKALNPVHFIAVRNVLGGPNEEVMKESLLRSKEMAKESMQWLNEKEHSMIMAEKLLTSFVTDWRNDHDGNGSGGNA